MNRPGILCFAACLGFFAAVPVPAADPPAPDPAALWSIGVLMWEYEVPNDLPEGEFDQFEWIAGASGKTETIDAGVSFNGIPRGTRVRLHLWLGDFLPSGAPRHQPDGIRYSMIWTEGAREQKRFGVMKIPEGYDQWFGHQAAGELLNADIGWKLMLMKSGMEDGPMAMLELVAAFEEPGKTLGTLK
ncbi:MAG: hypothetical protein JNJ70_22100 [Verrucomicrobiales bacterium]|nr:hypothetical protein [Verrucomicrobiales bacterium]